MQLLPFVFIVASISFTKAFVKIDVSKLTSTSTTEAQTDTTSVTLPTTLATVHQNVTDKSIISSTTSMPTTTVIVTPTNASANTTSNPELNQTELNVTGPSLDDHLPRTSRIKISPDHYYCSCDLMVNFCDINCCCDNDCSDDMLAVFVCNEKHWSIYDFEFDAGLTSCDIRNDLFCVVGKEVISDRAVFDVNLFNERAKYKWPTMFATDGSNDENRENYKSGDTVLTFDDKTEEIGSFGE